MGLFSGMTGQKIWYRMLHTIDTWVAQADPSQYPKNPVFTDSTQVSRYLYQALTDGDGDLVDKYGNKIRLLGNLDKRKLRLGGEIMKKEVDRGIAVAKEYGGYIPGVDHVVADFTYSVFKEYADYIQTKL